MARLELAVIGDVHGYWSAADEAYFNASGYAALLFVGDLATYLPHSSYAVARRLSRLRRPAFLIPGNHDGTTLLQLAAEAFRLRPLLPAGGLGMAARLGLLERCLGPVVLCGYSWHSLGGLGLIAGRPHAMGGGLSFGGFLARRFGVRSLEESAERLRRLVDACPHRELVFLAHNGPAGLGERATDIWGCDFKPGEGDWGDPDLRTAIDYALGEGRRVLAVVAGHMHQRTRQREKRAWRLERGGVQYVNAARVPRISRGGLRHYVALSIGDGICSVEERLVR